MANFNLRYSPLFYNDLDEITNYLLHELKNELATQTLVNKVESAIQKRLTDPLSTTPYRSVNQRQHVYRRIIVGNYLIFYVVIDDDMIIRRMLYGRRDLDRIL
jgi:toxin ParE1/3/4